MKFPVNQELYGVTLEEINHAIDGGLYAEMVLNGSFEANVPPLNCPYDRRTNEKSIHRNFGIHDKHCRERVSRL